MLRNSYPFMGRGVLVLVVVLFTVLSAGTVGGQSAARGSDVFDDVPVGHWADEPIGWAVDSGITRGVGEGRFGLEGIVNRAQIITFLFRTVDFSQGSPGEATSAGSDLFDDVPAGHWADEPIGWAVGEGIVEGVGERMFGLEATVPRSEIVSLLHRTVNLIQGRPLDASHTPGGSDSFDDVPPGHEADGAIGWAVANGITAGIGNRLFDPDGTVTRAQIVTFLFRTTNLLRGDSAVEVPDYSPESAPVRFGFSPCCADTALWQIPIEKGWFDEAHITIEPEGGSLYGPTGEAIAALQQGDWNVAALWVPSLFSHLETFGQSLPPISIVDPYIGYMILMPPDGEAKTALEFMAEGMSFSDAAEQAVEQLVGKSIHMPPHTTQQAQYANAFFAYLDEWDQRYRDNIPLLDGAGNQLVLLGRDGNPVLDHNGNTQPIHISTADWRYYAKPRYVDDPTIIQMSATPGQVEFAMPLGAPTAVHLIRLGWEPLISFEMLFEHDALSHQTTIAADTTGTVGLVADRQWASGNKDTVYRLLSVGYRTLAYLEDPATQEDGWAIEANFINTHRQLSMDAVDVGILWDLVSPSFTWEDQEALWDINLPSYHPETAFVAQIENLKWWGILSQDFDTETELARFLLAQDLYYEMKAMQERTDQLFAQAAGMELSERQAALVEQARTYYQHYNFLDSLRSLETALPAKP